ncbi:hypothetical protein FOA43_000945 [Brettanomyces nanus]|uniref:Uncharacterized protein n=1 Tax=Eeniella nana TaxID=13502 RepID=A0A875RYE0_EENNA|nr:uncharacterized protein FOA43_000945 [Brettanomyces nanus]QPG73633.1 hypothetical protein FOA43_000945 [Brettanomyces nanus]
MLTTKKLSKASPLSELKRSRFEKYSVILSKAKEVRLVDLKSNPGLFNPQAFPSGRLIYHFSDHNDDSETLFLHDFEPFRKTFLVVGIMQWTDRLTDDKVRESRNNLKKLFPNVVSHFIIAFDAPSSATTKVDGVHLINQDKSNLVTAVCEISSRFLAEFSTYASSYQHVTLRSPGSIIGSKRPTPGLSLMAKQRRRISGSFDLNVEKSKKYKTKGRRLKLYANFYLLAGNLRNSLSNFCEAIFYLKSVNDYLWLASALDGLSTCILLLARVDTAFQLPGFVSTLLDSNSSNGRDSVLMSPFSSPASSPRPSLQLPVSISSSIQASSSVQLSPLPLSSIWEMIHRIFAKTFEFYQSTFLQGEDCVPLIVFCECNLRFIGLFTSVCIERELNRSVINHTVYGTCLSRKRIPEDIGDFDHVEFSGIFSQIFSDRFEELSTEQKCTIYDFMISTCDKLRLFRKKSLLVNGFIQLMLSTGLENYRYIYTNAELREVLDSHCQVYGINAAEFPSFRNEPNVLQKKMLFEVFEFCQQVSFLEGVVKYGSILLADFPTLLTDGEQQTIYKGVREDMSKTEAKDIRYWDQQVLQNIEFRNESNDYLVQNELSDALITVRNPFAFDIEISGLQVCSADDTFSLTTQLNSRRQNLISIQYNVPILLRPRTTVSVPIFLVPDSSGKLNLVGIMASICGCDTQLFKTMDDQSNEDDNAGNRMKCKSISLKNTLDVVKQPMSKTRVWSVNVIYEQPLLKLVEVKLSNKWILLLEGECKKFDITLKNYSHVEINNMVSTFIDSTIEPLNQLLTNKNLSPNEVYEIEYYLIKKKPFQILNKKEMQYIKGNNSFNLAMEIWGKRGVKEAKLILEYSHKRKEDTFNEYDFTRSITIPVNVSVYPSVELVGCDIIPLSSRTKVSTNNHGDCWTYLEKMTSQSYKMSDFCLLALDFLNSWTEEMEVTVQCLLTGSTNADFQEQNGPIVPLPEDSFNMRLNLRSKKSVRVLIPIKRMDFTEEMLNQRIPSLRNKQFIYDSRTPLAEQVFIKHAFWYRDELLKRIRACWKIPDKVENSVYAGRFGTIDLRSIRFSSKMVSILEVEKIGLNIQLLDTQEKEIDSDAVQLNTFYTLRVILKNRNDTAVFGMLRHLPVCRGSGTPLEKKVLFNGVLQKSIGKELKPGESRQFDLGIVFLEKGEYEWGALFDEMEKISGKMAIKDQHLQREQLKVKVC